MKIRYTPFSERMVIDQPVKGLDFANDMIQMYFMMSLRYRDVIISSGHREIPFIL